MVPFLLISSLFFMWGFAHAVLEVLNPHLKNLLGLNHANASWVQVATYAAYFLMAIPAGKIIQRWGYRGGVLTGLVLYGVGALLFLPICLWGVKANNPAAIYPAFVGLLFVIGCGLTCLETSANPYVTVLGEKSSAEQRINLAQSLNGLGWICGPFVGGLFFFGDETGTGDIATVATPYVVVGIFVLLVALGFKFSKLPEVGEDYDEEVDEYDSSTPKFSSLMNPVYIMGVVALFLYVAAQTGVNSNFVAYFTEYSSISRGEASLWLSFGGMGLFFVGRLCGSWLMGHVKAWKVLLIYAIGATLGSLVIITCRGMVSMAAFFLVYLCESIMFPTIFSLALRGAVGQTKRASSYLIMTIVGGAVAPLLMGCIADSSTLALAFMIPLLCYVVIAAYAASLKRRVEIM
ncbi:MAG: sugar MFS transporter [Bacteroidaceae bacterium]|nr:sugar MFS transporter [Bacteroidaceae bacterium]MBR4782581.1 sugar MFS transporter [Bacteroidaceae bacterium]